MGNGGNGSGLSSRSMEVNDQVDAWKEVWGDGLEDKGESVWPDDLGTVPPMIIVQALFAAAMTFPRETGLGWDLLHPRALNRLSHGTLLWLCAVMHQAEKTGKWPEAAELVLIALLP